MLTVLHTSDWHLGRLLYGRSREQEFQSFLDWLLHTIHAHQVDVLLIAGDIFDSSTPSHHVQAMYYQFLSAVSQTACQHVVVIGGNHDSPTLLNAPHALLKALQVHVIGHALDPEDEVLLLRDRQQQPLLIVAAVPYLRERDVRLMHSGERLEEKAARYRQGVEAHYQQVAQVAQQYQQGLNKPVPIIAMGHLFTVGGHTQADDGVRDLVVGGLGHIAPHVFDQVFDYVALGHLHVPQQVGQRDWVRYSGSPLPMGFGEATQRKSVCLLSIYEEGAATQAIPAECSVWRRHGFELRLHCLAVPVFQRLQRIEGNWAAIEAQLQACKEQQESIWLEIIYTGDEVMGTLRTQIEELIQGSELELLKLQNQQLMKAILAPMRAEKPLPELTPLEVFERRLIAAEVAPEQHEELKCTYLEALQLLAEGGVEQR